MSSPWSEFLSSGIKVAPGSEVPVRKELRDLTQMEMYLYLEGLAKFQAVDQEDPLSYYKIAGIHGRPFSTRWPDLDWNNDIPILDPDKPRGFCTHSSIVFLTWHRPYLALFESALYKHVNDIANGIDDSDSTKSQYVALARSFRIPYWDWARRDVSTIFPIEALFNKFSQLGPPSKASVNPQYNPLFEYPFQRDADPQISMNGDATVRYPNQPNAARLIQTAITQFYNRPDTPVRPGKNLTERVAYILLSYQRFGSISNNQYWAEEPGSQTANAGTWGSLEDIHNSVHGLTGGGGHMSFVPISSFDPIFWLHHTNVDRLFDIWQSLHQNDAEPRTWVTEKRVIGAGSATIPQGGREGPKTLLYPFRDTENSWYDSDKTKKTEDLGYTYIETRGMKYPTNDTQKAEVKRRIEQYYTPISNSIRLSKAKVSNAGEHLLPQAELLRTFANKGVKASSAEALKLADQVPEQQVLLKKSLEPEKPVLRDLAPNNKYLEWLVNIKAQKHALNGEYQVHVFLDAVEEENPGLWPLSPNYIGSFVPLGSPTDTGCSKCQEDQQNQTEVTSQIPLTIALVERYLIQRIPDMTVPTVVEYLKRNLHWRVAVNGQILADRSQVAGLTVFVVSNEVTVPEDENSLPVYARDVTIYPEITTKLGSDSEGRGEGTGLVGPSTT